MRTIIELPTEQIQGLAKLVDQEKTSRTELIRRAIANYLEQYQVSNDDAFGAWKGNKQEGLEYQNKLRDEWSV